MKVKNKIFNICKAFFLPVVVWLVFSLLTGGRFASWANLMSILRTSVVPLLLAMSMSFGMLMGIWNFASGAVVYACAIFSALFARSLGLGLFWVCVFSILIGIVLSAIMGGLYRLVRVPFLVLSLGLAMVIEALPGMFIADSSGKIKLADSFLGTAPWSYIILLIMFLIFAYINSYTTLGANVRAIGADIKIADSAGINIDRVKFITFIISGLFLGVAGIVHLSINVTVTGVVGFASAGMIFNGMMGIFIAFVLTKYISFNIAVIIGTITIRMLNSGLIACGFSSEIQGILTGVFLLIVVTYSANAGLMDRIKARNLVAEKANAAYTKIEASDS